jgi:hypothetical protein
MMSVMGAPGKYSAALQERATRMALEGTCNSDTPRGAIKRIEISWGDPPRGAADLRPAGRDRRRVRPRIATELAVHIEHTAQFILSWSLWDATKQSHEPASTDDKPSTQ